MSEPERDQWRLTLPKGQFFENLQGDDALKKAASLAGVAPVEPPAVVAVDAPATSQPEPPAVVLPTDESSAADEEIMELEGVDPAWLSTPEGQKRTQEIFACNADKLRFRCFSGVLTPGWVRLPVVYQDRTEDTSRQCSESFAPPTEIVQEKGQEFDA